MLLCLPFGRAAPKKSRILHEMLYADLGIKDIPHYRLQGRAYHFRTAHSMPGGTSKGFWLPLGQESVGTQQFFSRIGMGLLLWNPALFWW